MASSITYYPLVTNAVTPYWWGNLQMNGTAPVAADAGYGWTPGTTAIGTSPYWEAFLGATNPATTKAGTSYIASAAGPRVGTGDLITTASDSFMTPTPLIGMFAATAWTFNWNFQALVAGAKGRINMRVWASPDPTLATVPARELTSGSLNCATITLSTTADANSTISWSPGALYLNNEYLFFQLEWQETTTGTSSTDNVLFRAGTSSIVTPVLNELPIPSIDSVPIGPLRVDWTHPLARGLVTCYVPGTMGGKDLAAMGGALDLHINTSTGSIIDTFGGPALFNSNSSVVECPYSAAIPSTHPTLNWTNGTLFWDGCLTVAGGLPGDYNNPFLINYNNLGTPPYVLLGFTTENMCPLSFATQWNTGATLTTSGAYSPGITNQFAPFNLAASALVGGNVLSYLNGVLFDTTAFGASAATSAATACMSINGSPPAYSASFATRIAAFWNRVLSADEIAYLSVHPFCFLTY